MTWREYLDACDVEDDAAPHAARQLWDAAQRAMLERVAATLECGPCLNWEEGGCESKARRTGGEFRCHACRRRAALQAMRPQ